jgi:hypothetical protein
MLIERSVEALNQVVFVEGLDQVANCSGPKRLRTSALIGKGREENEWHAVPLGKQVRL